MKNVVFAMLAGATVAAGIFAPSPGKTYPISVDYSKYSCGDFLSMPASDQKIFTGWLSGWFMQKSNTTNFDFTRFQINLTSVSSWCSKNKTALLMSSVDQAMKSPASIPYNPGGKTMEMSQIKCSDYLGDPDPNNQRFIAAWMSGYYNSKINRTTVSWNRFEDNVRSVWKYCNGHKADTLMNVIANSNQVKVL